MLIKQGGILKQRNWKYKRKNVDSQKDRRVIHKKRVYYYIGVTQFYTSHYQKIYCYCKINSSKLLQFLIWHSFRYCVKADNFDTENE